MTEAPEQATADYAHILTDLHALTREVAALAAYVQEIGGSVARMEQNVDELAPAARRAAAMLDTPVTSFLAMRKEAANGADQRAGTRAGRRLGARAARRKLPDA